VGAVRHKFKSSGTQKYDAFINGCCNGRVYFVIRYGIYMLPAIGLPPSGSSTVHNYTKTVHRSTQWNGTHRTHIKTPIRLTPGGSSIVSVVSTSADTTDIAVEYAEYA